MPHGYSGTPLVKKLGIKSGMKIRFLNAPDNYAELLGPLPDEVELRHDYRKTLDFIHLFATDLRSMEKKLPILKDKIHKHGMIWVSWYKKSSKIPTDLTEDLIRESALALGLVDVKVCAVDERWSALKIVWRKENR
ncbi:MAG: DUF3052 domain-containing protein [Bacteroidota bacterium]